MRKCIIKALKMMTFLTAAVIVVVYASCTAATQNVQETTGTDGNNEVTKTYFTKDTSSGFQAFLTDPEGNCAASRAAAADSDGTVTENDMFAGLWSTLTEEEKEMVLESPEKASVSCDSSIAVDADSATGRAALDGDDTKLEDLAVLYEYTAKLQDWFGDSKLPLSLIPDSIPNCTVSVLPAAGIFDKYIREGNWDTVDSFLAYLDYPVSLAVLQTEAAKVNAVTGSTASERASSAVDFYDTPIRYNVGNTLKDGTVLLTVSKKKAYVVAGSWSHGGIFSLKQFKITDTMMGTIVYTRPSLIPIPVFPKICSRTAPGTPVWIQFICIQSRENSRHYYRRIIRIRLLLLPSVQQNLFSTIRNRNMTFPGGKCSISEIQAMMAVMIIPTAQKSCILHGKKRERILTEIHSQGIW